MRRFRTNLWKIVEVLRYFTDVLMLVVDRVRQKNGYFGYPEAMPVDPKQNVRDFAPRRILKASKKWSRNSCVSNSCINLYS